MGASCDNCLTADNAKTPPLSKKQAKEKYYRELKEEKVEPQPEMSQKEILISQQRSKHQDQIFLEPRARYICLNDEAGGFCGEDIDRVSPNKMSSLPYRLIGAVISVGPANSIQYGTGILLSKDLVLTCAHVIYNKPHQAYYDKISFYPALFGDMKKWIRVEQFKAHEKYGEQRPFYDPRSYDYALLKLKEPVEQADFLQLCDDPTQITEDDTLSIFGYPVSKYQKEDGKPVASKQYGLERKGYILDLMIEAGYIIHKISTEPGQSGAPVIKTQQNGMMSIVGIHIASTEQNIEKYQQHDSDLKKVNLTKVLTKPIVKNLQLFAKQLGGTMFKVQKQRLIKNFSQKKDICIQKHDKNQKVKILKGQTIKKKAKQYFNDAIDYYQAKKYELTAECFRLAIQIDPNYGKAYYGLGSVLDDIGKKDEAIENYRKAIQLDPNFVDAYNGLGSALDDIGQYKEAIENYRKAIKIDPNYKEAYNNIGNALKNLGRYKQALQKYYKAIEVDHNIKHAYENMKIMLMRKQCQNVEMYQKSIVFLEGIIAQHPQNKRAITTMNVLKEKLKKLKQ